MGDNKPDLSREVSMTGAAKARGMATTAVVLAWFWVLGFKLLSETILGGNLRAPVSWSWWFWLSPLVPIALFAPQYLRGAGVLLSTLALSPFTRLLRKRTDKIPTLAEFRFDWSRTACQIRSRFDPAFEDRDALLVAGYIAFLFRYFYICDKLQVPVVAQYLAGNLPMLPQNRERHASDFYRAILSLYDRQRQQAAVEFFGQALPGSRTHVEAGELRERVATYTMRLSDDLKSVFDLSAGYDLFLLPQMVLVFYFYVSEKLTDESRRQMFDHFVLDALRSHARWDPRAMQTMIHGPARLLKERGQAA